MNELFENPMPILLMGGLTAAILIGVMFTTGRGVFLFAGLGVLCLTGVGVLVEWAVVTETEEVEIALYAARSDLEANDLDALLAHLAPDADDVQSLARSTLRSFEIDRAVVGSDLEIVVNKLTSPPSARATFLGKVSAKSRRGESLGNYLARVEVKLVRAGDAWLIAEVSQRPLR